MLRQMKNNKKGLAMDMKSLGVTIVVVGLLTIIGVLIFAKIDNSLDSQIYQWDPELNTVTNESLVPLTGVSVTPANVPLYSCGDAYNGTQKIAAANYTCTPSAGLVLAAAANEYNNSGDFTVTYTYNQTDDAYAARETVRGTVLDSMELAIIALVVLAAVVILAILFMLGGQ